MDKRRIMLIDDEEDFLKMTKLNLEDTGRYEVLALSNAKDVIVHIHSFKPDIIVLDLLMPHIGGIEACEIINNDPLGKGIPIIVLSVLEKDGDKLAAYKRGIVDYLVKPIGKNELIAKIEHALQFK